MYYAVIDLGYGDAGKGTVVNRLCSDEDRKIDMVIRFNGGPQAAHNVTLDSGLHHEFRQFGSGTLQGVDTFLSEFMLVDPLHMALEAEQLLDKGIPHPFRMMFVSPKANMVTPYHARVNRAQEKARIERGNGHGSTGMGIGATVQYAIDNPELAPTMADLENNGTLNVKLVMLEKWALAQGADLTGLKRVDLMEHYTDLADLITVVGDDFMSNNLGLNAVFEGSQGVLLDEHVGFHPYTTWSTTTDHNIHTLMDDAGLSEDALEIIGVVRSYATRHGVGPFVTEDKELPHKEPHNKTGEWMGPMRNGHLDLVALEYAIRQMVCVDSLYVTHTDTPMTKVCTGYIHPWSGEYALKHIDPRDLAARDARSHELMDVVPQYQTLPAEGWDWPDIARRLGLELAGIGFGESTTAGAFTQRMVPA